MAEIIDNEMRTMMQIIDKSQEIADVLRKGNSVVIKAASDGSIKCYEQKWSKL